jgi:hypothetical protein
MGPPVGLQRVSRQHGLHAGRHVSVLPAGHRLVAVSAAGEGEGPSSAGKEALLARIAAAKRYKETGGSAGVSSSGRSSSGDGGASSPGPLPVDRRAPIDYSRMAEFLSNPKQSQQGGAAGDVDGPYVPPASALEEPTVSSNPVPFLERTPQPDMSSAETAQLILSATQAPGRGSATEAAAALAAVLNREDTLDKSMRAEEFTQAQVERQKQIGAEILEGSYNDTQSPRERARAVVAGGEAAKPWDLCPL